MIFLARTAAHDESLARNPWILEYTFLGCMMVADKRFSLGVDVGGTFTDFVLLDEITGRISIGKDLTTPSDPSVSNASGDSDLLKGRRDVYFPGRGMVPATPVYDRYRLSAGARFAGPAVFEERESTFVVGFDARIRVDQALNLVAELN